jgi:uncharacterized hydrophobic protein (TIGR00341 family)
MRELARRQNARRARNRLDTGSGSPDPVHRVGVEQRRVRAMQLKIIEVVAPKGHADTIAAIAEQHGAVECWVYGLGDGEQSCVRILTAQKQRQTLVDRIHSQLGSGDNWRLAILPVDGTLPTVEAAEEQTKAEQARSITATREELYNSVAVGAELHANYMLLVALSTIVAGIGLVTNNVAVVVGAMVIAPLLGPNLALALAAALGDRALMAKAAGTSATGIVIAILLPAVFSLLAPITLDSRELLLRTTVGYDGIALALASGAAAALSLTTGLSTTLVGVMVAVALLPPAATAGLMLGANEMEMATGALALLAVNVISVILAAEVVFFFKGITPHRWFERKEAHQSVALTSAIWLVLLAAAALLIALKYF